MREIFFYALIHFLKFYLSKNIVYVLDKKISLVIY